MNLVLHLIKKDLRRVRWALICWAIGLGFLLLRDRAAGRSDLQDYLHISALLMVVVLGIGLITDFIQADHPADENSHWRTLPISAGRMALAKLLVIGTLFVALPVAVALLRSAIFGATAVRFSSEFALLILILTAISLSLAAAAACTRNVVHALALWLVLIFGAGSLADYLGRFMPAIDRKALAAAGMDKALAILGLSVACGLAVVLNQYLRRRPVTSVTLLLIGAIGAALIGAFWGYFYFYGATAP